MTSWSHLRRSAALVLLVACKPIFYDIAEDGDPIPATEFTEPSPTEPDLTTTLPPDPDTSSTPPDPDTCFDSGLNNGESDFDCGGPCPPCGPGEMCFDPDDCTAGACEFGKCPEPPCTSDEQCKLIVEGVPCMTGMCVSDGVCIPVPAFDGEPCEDFDACVSDSVCVMGQCLGNEVPCEKLSGPCRSGFCNPQTGNCAAEFWPPGSECDDGLACTAFDACDDLGECVGKSPPPLFFEDFAMQQGWSTDMLWEIGPAIGSMCGGPGEDPFEDHSDTDDNSLAGVVIGGCVPPEMFPPQCLTSPPIQVAPGPLVLRFWSWFGAFDPTVEATVEVFDGMGWIPLLSVQDLAVDQEWLELVVDLPVTEPIVMVRFCQSMTDFGMPTGGWSVDDISIGPPSCAP